MSGRSRAPGIWRTWATLIAGAWRMVRRAGAKLIALLLVSQLLILAVVFPIIQWLYRETLRAGGMHGLDLGTLILTPGLTLSLALVVAIVLIALWLVSLQFSSIVVLLHRVGHGLTAGTFLRELGRIARKVLRPSSIPLIFYLFLLLPLTGFGFTTVIAQGIAIPPFISGELLKSVSGGLGLAAILIVLSFANLRFSLTIPLFVLTQATGVRASRLSWRLTRRIRDQVAVVLAVSAVIVAAAVMGVALFIAALVPTAVSDELWPSASPVIAAYSLGLAQLGGLLLTGITTAFIAAMLMRYVEMRRAQLPLEIAAEPSTPEGASTAASRPARWLGAALAGTMVLLAAGLGTASIPTMQRISAAPESLILAHRGFSDGGVENTIGGLEAAAAAHADLVEIDVLETKDHRFAVMHDAHLGRLADRDELVKDLTLDELSRITVRDLQGNIDTIPSLERYLKRADELGMPLLIEIKLGGADSDDHVQLLVAELERLGELEKHIYHSLDPASVETLKSMRPDLTVGYTMAFAAVDVPVTPADFLVVEQWTATENIQRAAERAGLGFMAWTVNDEPGFREHLRRGTDGIITDHPDLVVAARTEMQESEGMADALLDALTRFVTVV